MTVSVFRTVDFEVRSEIAHRFKQLFGNWKSDGNEHGEAIILHALEHPQEVFRAMADRRLEFRSELARLNDQGLDGSAAIQAPSMPALYPVDGIGIVLGADPVNVQTVIAELDLQPVAMVGDVPLYDAAGLEEIRGHHPV